MRLEKQRYADRREYLIKAVAKRRKTIRAAQIVIEKSMLDCSFLEKSGNELWVNSGKPASREIGKW